MTDKQISLCIAEAQNYKDRDSFVSDLSLSTMWGDDPEAPVPLERVEWLSSVYDACRRSVKEIAADAGMSQRKLAERFCIPYRTIENWCGGKNACPLYIRLMMQEILGLLQRS